MNRLARLPIWAEPGYARDELDCAQEKWNLEFPPDLMEFLLWHRPFRTGEGFFDWIRSSEQEIHQLLAWPFNGFWFDVQHHGVWWADWGPKPEQPALQMLRLKEIFRDVPKLIPIYGRRYLPSLPFESGNPVFSIYQTDIVCFGETLDHWLKVEFAGLPPLPGAPKKEISFWSRAIHENEARLNSL